MPLYEYRCEACKQTSEFLQSIKEGMKRRCPHCGQHKLRRQIGTGIGARFKGSGFYETDYKQPRSNDD